jgi:hypothetical protein
VTRQRADWLDRLALRSVERPVQDADAHEMTLGSEEQFSRKTAIKLAVAGAAALSLGLGTAPAARAQDRGKCFTDCLKTHDEELARRIRSCGDVFQPRHLERAATAREKDRQYLSRIFSFGGERDLEIAAAWLLGLCDQKAEYEVRRAKEDCYGGCETTCRQRSVQSASGRSAATCEVTPPPHAPPPSIPPIPNPDSGIAAECANCAIKGGECCAGADAMHLCGCADYDPDGPETPCQRVGCG